MRWVQLIRCLVLSPRARTSSIVEATNQLCRLVPAQNQGKTKGARLLWQRQPMEQRTSVLSPVPTPSSLLSALIVTDWVVSIILPTQVQQIAMHSQRLPWPKTPRPLLCLAKKSTCSTISKKATIFHKSVELYRSLRGLTLSSKHTNRVVRSQLFSMWQHSVSHFKTRPVSSWRISLVCTQAQISRWVNWRPRNRQVMIRKTQKVSQMSMQQINALRELIRRSWYLMTYFMYKSKIR